MDSREYIPIPSFTKDVSALTHSAKSFDVLYVNTLTNTVTINLFATPINHDEITIIDAKNNCHINNIFISGNGKTIDGSSNNLVVKNMGAIVKCYYLDNNWTVKYDYKRNFTKEVFTVVADSDTGTIVTIPNSKKYTMGINTLVVYINGLLADWTEISTTSVRMNFPLLIGDEITFVNI